MALEYKGFLTDYFFFFNCGLLHIRSPSSAYESYVIDFNSQ